MPRKKWSNITNVDKKTIKDLKEKDVICLPSDKGTEFCIIQKDRYSQAALDHLNDSNTYQKVPRMTAKTVENKVNLVWKNICSRNKFPPFVVKSFVASNTELPKFYHLIKTHKTGPDIKIRPIVSNINGPTQRISWLLSKTLKPLLTSVPTHLENSYELIERIQDGDSNNNKTLPYPCSLDVVSLYTSIPIQEAIDNTVDRIEHGTFHLSRLDVAELLNVTLNNMYFTFEDRIFRQTEGLPMGSSISGILAILFMDKLEQIALSSYRLISPYKRYVDDIYLQTANEEKANEFHDTMNSLHPRLKFEIEKPTASPEGLSLSLLDFKVTITTNGESSFEFYKKPAKKPLFVHHQSALPKRSKTNFIRNERRRIQQRCSTQITSNKHDRDFDNILRLNGYPERTIHETKHLQNHQRDPQTQTKEWHYLKIPFISDRLNRKITGIFKRENIPVRIAHKSYTLRQALSHNTTERKCNRPNCPIADTNLCLQRNTVYQLTCKACGEYYIGSTTRFLHDRTKEHLTNDNSSVKKHLTTHHRNNSHNIEVKVITRENDPVNLRLYEAYYIRKHKPGLNSREECTELNDLLF